MSAAKTSSDQPPGVDTTDHNLADKPNNPCHSNSHQGSEEAAPLLQLDPEEQHAAVRMTHYLNALMCMVSEHFTSLER